jgi:vacuolar-type H+-ATPase subunit C/Vma6
MDIQRPLLELSQRVFLREEQYSALVGASNLAEFKVCLDETDYGKYII